jgi:dTDP-4-dehydrorhamnose reductase
MGKTVLVGANGQLASDIILVWPESALATAGEELVPLRHADMDVTDAAQVRAVLDEIRPDLAINTAAFVRVDDCESDAAPAFSVNALGVKNLAEACRDLGARLLHLSTDYVFDGRKQAPYLESDPMSPISAYGVSKAAGEHILRYVLPDDHIIVRSSGLYGVAGASGKGGNFVETMLRLAGEGRQIRVVDDQISAPTFTLDLARTLLDVAARGGSGIFHVTNAGQCSWYEFASEAFRLTGLKPDLEAITSVEYGAPARRPAYSVLENACLRPLGLEQPRPWREALRHYLHLKGRLA